MERSLALVVAYRPSNGCWNTKVMKELNKRAWAFKCSPDAAQRSAFQRRSRSIRDILADMVNYRRAQQPGGTFFFTLTLSDRSSALLTEHVDALRSAFRDEQLKKPFKIDAIVILPEHLHCIWTLPDGDTDFSGRWRSIKSSYARRLRKLGVQIRINEKGEADIWQRRFWEHQIRDEKDF